MSKKGDNSRGDAFLRDKSKGGMRNIPAKGDGVGGKLMQLSGLIDELKSFVEERFLGANQYESIEGAQDVFQRAIDLFSAIHKVDEDEAYDALNQFFGQLISVMRESQLTKVRVDELDQRLNDLAAEKLRASSAATVKSGATEFMDALVEHLGYYHNEFTKLVKRYGEACLAFEKEKQEIDEDALVIELEAQRAAENRGEDNLRTALFFASTRQVALEKELEILRDKRVTLDSKDELRRLWQRCDQDKAWIKTLRDKVEALKKRILEHDKKINLADRSGSGETKRQIIFIKEEIEKIRCAFKMVNKEDLFWGCVFGLHEIVEFAPVNVLVYGIELNDRSLFGFSSEEYLSKESALKQDYEKHLQLPVCQEVEVFNTSPVENLPDEDDDDESNQLEPVMPGEEALGERGEELINLCLCVLWGLVDDFIKKAQLASKQLIRGGDFGRMPRKVAKLLFLTGAISRDEKEKITKQLPKIMEDRGLVRIQLRKAIGKKYKTGESCSVEKPWLFLTEAGRERGRELLLQPSGQQLVTRVIQENIKVEERYLEKHLGIKAKE
ncbi:MAG: hypothetical protein AAB575_04545 [Patescibacteria group bacterium]